MGESKNESPSSLVDDPTEDLRAPEPWMNLNNTFVTIDGVRHKTTDLLKLVIEHFKKD